MRLCGNSDDGWCGGRTVIFGHGAGRLPMVDEERATILFSAAILRELADPWLSRTWLSLCTRWSAPKA